MNPLIVQDKQHLLPLEHILCNVLSQGDEILNDQDKNFAAIL